MRKQTDYIVTTLRSVLEGEPWFGRSVMSLLQEVDAAVVNKKPGKNAHTLNELLYHMITWAEFTLARLEKSEEKDMAYFEDLDWRKIVPKEHTWEKGVAQFKVTHDLIIDWLEARENDEYLSEIVDYRKYNVRFMLHGLIQHDIYHIGQIAYAKKLLDTEKEEKKK